MGFEHSSASSIFDNANSCNFMQKPSHNRVNTIDPGLRQVNVDDVQNCTQDQSRDSFSSSLPRAGLAPEVNWLHPDTVAFPSSVHEQIAGDDVLFNQFLNNDCWAQDQVGSRPVIEGSSIVFARPGDPDSPPPIQDINNHLLQAHSAQDQASALTNDILQSPTTQDPKLPQQQRQAPHAFPKNPTREPAANRRSKPLEKACKDFSKGNCDKIFTNERTLGDHLLKVHNLKAFPCPNTGCIYQASRKDNVNLHKKRCKCGKRSSSPSTTTTTQLLKRSRLSKDSQPVLFIQPQPTETHPMLYTSAPDATIAALLPSFQIQSGESSLINTTTPFISMGDGNSIAINTQVPSSQPETHIVVRPLSRAALERENAKLREEVDRLTKKVGKLKTRCKSLIESFHVFTKFKVVNGKK
ncbi:uncharacterized protein DFL_009258 [Arthrobotrys flagrans]|uniref:C2H2-type domain-containing protein n=1 Tax=Arthrobotrys flagrans TaxID=97331 RepID=A0A436ZRH5_ARTFL|nr:hypothetical protein DFL_009258 [Arthrobotrys flagrans]